MSTKHDLLLEETKHSFDQRIMFMRSVDIKAFGAIAIDAVLISVFTLILNTLKNQVLFIPYIAIIISILYLAKCIFPIEWDIMGALKIIKSYGDSDYDYIIKRQIASYADLDEILKSKYEIKYKYLLYGLKALFIAMALELLVVAILFALGFSIHDYLINIWI